MEVSRSDPPVERGEHDQGRGEAEDRSDGVKPAPALEQCSGLSAGVARFEPAVHLRDHEQGERPVGEQKQRADQPELVEAPPPQIEGKPSSDQRERALEKLRFLVARLPLRKRRRLARRLAASQFGAGP